MVFVGSLLYIASYIADRHRLHLGRPARAAGLRRPPCPSSSSSGPTSSSALLVAAGASTPGACCGNAEPARDLGARCSRDRAGAVRRRSCCWLFAVVDAARQRALPARAAGASRARGRRRSAYDTRTESLLDVRPGAPVATRETDLLARRWLRSASPRSRSSVDGETERVFPRLQLRRRAPEATRTRSGPATSRAARRRPALRPGWRRRGGRRC